jgi:hypothetical protein
MSQLTLSEAGEARLVTLFPEVEWVEEMTYFVQSASNAHRQWTVDMRSNRGHGECQCPDFRTRRAKELERGAEPVGDRLACRHVRLINRWLAWRYKIAQLEHYAQLEAQAKARPVDNHASREACAVCAEGDEVEPPF